MIFSLVKNNPFRITSVVFIVSLRDTDPSSVFNFSVSEQNYQVLVSIFLVWM